jgi:hypothetical protein
METLTKLRLLAPKGAVVAAELLHAADHDLTDATFRTDEAALGQAWEMSKQQAIARELLIDEARRSLALPRGLPIPHPSSASARR